MVRTLSFQGRVPEFNPGSGTKLLQVTWHGQKTKKCRVLLFGDSLTVNNAVLSLPGRAACDSALISPRKTDQTHCQGSGHPGRQGIRWCRQPVA